MKKIIFQILLAILALGIVITVLNIKKIKRIYTAIHLYDEDVIVENFQHIEKNFSATVLLPSPKPFIIPKDISYQLPVSFTIQDSTINVASFFNHTQHEGIMVIQNDTIIYEDYQRGLSPTETHISWSMSKSVLATLLGIAYHDGLFKLEEPITNYLPQFENTGYDNVRIKDILQMSSGVRFNEDYGDFNSDINRFGRTFAAGGSVEEFAKSLTREREPGTYCNYVSIDTQVLGILLKKITGKSITNYLNEKLWLPMGMQDSAQFIIDNTDMELVLGGLNMTMRDYAKMGLLYQHQGYFNNQQIVDSSWVRAAITPDAPHLMPGENNMSSHNFGYGYQWWVPEKDEGDFFAAGIYNQYIYVQPQKNLVIVKLTANHHFKNEGLFYKKVFINLFKEIAADL